MGVVEVRDGVKKSPHFPLVMEVENLPHAVRARLSAAVERRLAAAPRTDLSTTAKVNRFPRGLLRTRG
jgi:hypothetical protein